MKDTPFFVYNKDFIPFGTQHLIPMIAMVVLCIALPIIAKRFWSKKTQLTVSRIMAVTICFWLLLYTFILVGLGKFDVKTDLPVGFCSLIALLLPFLMWKPRYRVHEVFYFWILAGPVQAILTPELHNGFPNFAYLKYWIVHCGLVVYAVYMTVVFDFKPTLKSIWRAFLMIQVYTIFVFTLNYILGANYGYVSHKPSTASVLDYLGDWPWYVLGGQLVGLVIFFVAYLPIGLTRKRQVNKTMPSTSNK